MNNPEQSMQLQENISGVLQLNEKGFGFLRQAANNYLPGPKDIFVGRGLIQKYALREGVMIVGQAAPGEQNRGRAQSDQLAAIETINGLVADAYMRRTEFTRLTTVDPLERLELSEGNDNLSMRVLDV